jgi:hypothetical protein
MPASISDSRMSAVARLAGHKKSNNRKVHADLNIPTFRLSFSVFSLSYSAFRIPTSALLIPLLS